jgi:mono/diheme cytochrome c family protein
VSRVGRWCAIGAVVMGAITLAAWNLGADPSIADGVPEGRQLFHAKGCSGCHAGPESSPDFTIGFPSLAGAPAWAGSRRPGMTDEEYLRESIASPGACISPAFRPGGGPTTGMPQLRLTAAEIDALVGFLLHH